MDFKHNFKKCNITFSFLMKASLNQVFNQQSIITYSSAGQVTELTQKQKKFKIMIFRHPSPGKP